MGLAPNCEKRGTYWISAIQYLSVSRPRFPVANNGPAFVGPFRAHQLGKRVFLRRSSKSEPGGY
jgi:hypothetical protein